MSVDSLPEQLVREVQKTVTINPYLESRITKNIHRFSPRQCALILNGFSRAIQPPSRRTLHLLSQKLVAEMAHLTLRDMALVMHAISKFGIRHEIFVAASLGSVERKLQKTNVHTNKTVSATALICRSIVKLNLIGDGLLLRNVKNEYLSKWLEQGIVNEIDAVTLIPLVDEREQRNALLSLIESPTVKVSAAFILSKKGVSVPSTWWSEIDENWSTLTLVKKVHAFYALSIATLDHKTIPLARAWFNDIINQSQDISLSENKQVFFLLISAITRLVEILPEPRMVDFVTQSASFDTVKELAIVLNCLAGIRIELSSDLRAKIFEILDRRGEIDSHSFSIMVSSLARLGEFELVRKILDWCYTDREKFGHQMTDQGCDLSSLAIASVWDLDRDDQVLLDWLNVLLSRNPKAEESSSPESASQKRIVSSIIGSQMAASISPPTSPIIVSSFHSQVANTVEQLVSKINLNSIDATTGYEMDILIDS